MTIGQTKVRDSNLELYRILVMLAIVAHHYVVNSGLLPILNNEPTNLKSVFIYVVGMWGKTGINCFVLITGYFMCKSVITIKKFIKLILEIEFYNITIYVLFIAFGYTNPSLVDFLFVLFPIHSIHGDFVACYIVFFFFIPYLTILVNNINKKHHIFLISLCLGTYTLLAMIPGINVTKNYVTWFCILFIIGSYLRLHPIKDGNVIFWFSMFLSSIILAISSVLFFLFLFKKYAPYTLVDDTNAPLAVLVSVCAFMFFKNLKIKQSKFINIVGGGTFGVLLIHANSNTMRKWLWEDLCDNVGQYATNNIYLHAILVPILVFTICSIIEYLRMKTIERTLINCTYNLIRKIYPYE